MAEAVYILCAATSIACAVLLWRGYVRSKARLLLWSALCFVGLALNNVVLLVDLILLPTLDLKMLRTFFALAGLGVMIYGLIKDAE